MPRVHKVEKARKPNSVITQADIDRANAGEKGAASYYWWKFRFGGRRESKTYPRPSQLTQSDFLGQVYDLQDEIQAIDFSDKDDAESTLEDLVSRIRELGEEQDEKRNNMPEQLQDADVGEMLQNRYDSCEEWASELENIDLCELDIDESDIVTELREDDEDEWDMLSDDDKQEKIDAATTQKFEDAKCNVVEEIQNYEYQGE